METRVLPLDQRLFNQGCKNRTDHGLCFALQLFSLLHVRVSLLSAKNKEDKTGVGHTNLKSLPGDKRRGKGEGAWQGDGRGRGREKGGGGAYLSGFTCGFPGLQLPFGKEGTGKGFAASPEDPFKTHAHHPSVDRTNARAATALPEPRRAVCRVSPSKSTRSPARFSTSRAVGLTEATGKSR